MGRRLAELAVCGLTGVFLVIADVSALLAAWSRWTIYNASIKDAGTGGSCKNGHVPEF